MKNIIKYGLSCLMMSAAVVSFNSCSDKDETSDLTQAIYPGSVTMDIPEALRQLIYTDDTNTPVLPLIKGETVALGATVLPEDATYKDVVWSSNDATIVSVDGNGTLKAQSADGKGYAIIQVAPEAFYSGSGIYSTLKVRVSDEMIPAGSIVLTAPADQLYAGETLQLTAGILPAEATYRTVKWSSSDENIATVSQSGLVSGLVNDKIYASVVITATALDGTELFVSKELSVNQMVHPEDVTIDQQFSAANNYLFAISDKRIVLNYTTVPEDCTKSLIEWTTSDASIATVEGGVVTFNQTGNFGNVAITARCPQTGKTSTIELVLEEGLVRELFRDKNNYNWYNSAQSGNGTSSSHVWSEGKVTVTTYKQNETKQRGDFRCWSPKTWLHAGKYPIIAIRMDDLKDMTGVTARNITLDGAGTCEGSTFSGGLNGNNNQWLHDYKCNDGSHVFIYDMTAQKWNTGGLLPQNAPAVFTTLQFKYADIAPLTQQVNYNVYWVQTFKSIDDVKNYLYTEGLTYEIIK